MDCVASYLLVFVLCMIIISYIVICNYHSCSLCSVPPRANAQNAFKEWHIAFHGTAPKNILQILGTSAGGLVVHGEPVTALIM